MITVVCSRCGAVIATADERSAQDLWQWLRKRRCPRCGRSLAGVARPVRVEMVEVKNE